MSGNHSLVFVGSLTRGTPFYESAAGDGIHVLEFDEQSGVLRFLSKTTDVDNPTYLDFDPHEAILYATSEVFEWSEGVVSSYKLDLASNRLVYGNKQPTLGNLSVFVALDRRRRNVLVANYSGQQTQAGPGKALVVLPVEDGMIRPASSSARRVGRGALSDRQEQAHAHCLLEAPDGRLVAADLGTDEIAFYAYDSDAGRMRGEPSEVVRLPPGSGPRHVVINRDGSCVYVINEMAESVVVLSRTSAGERYRIVQEISSLPPGVLAGDPSCGSAGIVLALHERFLFVSNRGQDSIMSFQVNPADGLLRQVGACASGGRTPRAFAVSPSGNFLIVANQDGHNLTVLRFDPTTGVLSDNGTAYSIKSPMCVAATSLLISRKVP